MHLASRQVTDNTGRSPAIRLVGTTRPDGITAMDMREGNWFVL